MMSAELIFGGWSLVLMGVALAGDACGLAKSAADWGHREATKGLVGAYRVVGVALALAGALVGGCAAAGADWTARFKVPGTGAPALDGLLLISAALAMGWLRRRDLWRMRQGAPMGERVGIAGGWALIASFAGFGGFLIYRAGGLR